MSWDVARALRWCALPGMSGCGAGFEGLDDHHGAAASGTGIGAGRWFASVVGGLIIVGHGRRHGEQLAGPGEVGGAIAVGEQAVMADSIVSCWRARRTRFNRCSVRMIRDAGHSARASPPSSTMSSIQVSAATALGKPRVVMARNATCWSSSGDSPSAMPRRTCECTACAYRKFGSP